MGDGGWRYDCSVGAGALCILEIERMDLHRVLAWEHFSGSGWCQIKIERTWDGIMMWWNVVDTVHSNIRDLIVSLPISIYSIANA